MIKEANPNGINLLMQALLNDLTKLLAEPELEQIQTQEGN
jgi:hypothetical protein